MRKFARFILKRSWYVLAAGLLLTLFFIYYTSRLHIDNSVRTGFPSYNKDFQELEAFLRQFGGDELIVVAYQSDEIFSNKHLLAIDRISREIAAATTMTAAVPPIIRSLFLSSSRQRPNTSMPRSTCFVPDPAAPASSSEFLLTNSLLLLVRSHILARPRGWFCSSDMKSRAVPNQRQPEKS